MTFRLRGEDGKFVGFDSLAGGRYDLTVVDRRSSVVHFSESEVGGSVVRSSLGYIANTVQNLRRKDITLTRGDRVLYRVEVNN